MINSPLIEIIKKNVEERVGELYGIKTPTRMILVVRFSLSINSMKQKHFENDNMCIVRAMYVKDVRVVIKIKIFTQLTLQICR